jgi:pseudouridine synthase
MKERLQKFLARAGVASRRKAEQLITSGVVRVNGMPVTKLGSTVDPDHEAVTVQGDLIQHATQHWYIALNKPVGVVCSKISQRGEKTVYDLVPESNGFAVAGRLDKDSEGLVLLTNDGELVNRLTHPRYQHEKEYIVETAKPLDAATLNKLHRGIRLQEGKATMDRIEPLGPTVYRVVLHQGWKRQIRRMIAAVKNDVLRLKRIRIGKLTLSNMPKSQFRQVHRSDIV